jgi:hypothetical protein
MPSPAGVQGGLQEPAPFQLDPAKNNATVSATDGSVPSLHQALTAKINACEGSPRGTPDDPPSSFRPQVSSHFLSISPTRRRDILESYELVEMLNNCPSQDTQGVSKSQERGFSAEFDRTQFLTPVDGCPLTNLKHSSRGSISGIERTRFLKAPPPGRFSQSRVSSGVETLSEAELERVTSKNTKKNGHRNVKSRFARIFQTLETLALAPDLEALPLVRPDDSEFRVTAFRAPPRRRRAATIDLIEEVDNWNNKTASEESLSKGNAGRKYDDSMDVEPASIRASGPRSTSDLVFERPSVRISTGVTVVSTIDLARLGRKAAQLEEREHPNRLTARALVPRSQMVTCDDFKNVIPKEVARTISKAQ